MTVRLPSVSGVVGLDLLAEGQPRLQLIHARLGLVRFHGSPHILGPVGIDRVRIVVEIQQVAVILLLGPFHRAHGSRIFLLVVLSSGSVNTYIACRVPWLMPSSTSAGTATLMAFLISSFCKGGITPTRFLKSTLPPAYGKYGMV